MYTTLISCHKMLDHNKRKKIVDTSGGGGGVSSKLKSVRKCVEQTKGWEPLPYGVHSRFQAMWCCARCRWAC